MKTDWGELFKKYPYGEFPEYKAVQEWDPYQPDSDAEFRKTCKGLSGSLFCLRDKKMQQLMLF